MNQIEKNIFDALARRKGINLPGIGSLSVVRVPAEFITDSSIRPPYSKVIFSASLNPSFISAGEMKGYDQWLAHTPQGKGIREINGVGILKGNIFYPSVELHDILNPHDTRPVAVKPHYAPKRKIAVGIGVVAAAALVILAVILIDRFAGRQAGGEESMTGTAAVARQEARIAAARGESTIEVSIAGEAEEELKAEIASPARGGTTVLQGNTPATAAAKGQDGSTISSTTDSALDDQGTESVESGPVFHLVAGVFSDPENADKLISRDPLGIGSVNYRKIEFGKGKTLVSAFSSPDREKVDKRRRELSRINRDLWIYEKE